MGAGKGGSGIAKCILILFNILFLLIGILLLAVGVALKFAGAIIEKVLGGTGGLGELLKKLADSLPSSSPVPKDLDIQTIVNEQLGDFAIPLIVVGVFIFILAILGMCGACCKNKCMLIVYCVAVSIIIIAELIIVVLFVRGTLQGKVKAKLEDSLMEKYIGFDDFSPTSLLFNALMSQLECCGVNDYKDFDTAIAWERNITLEQEINGKKFNLSLYLEVPLLCCKQNGTTYVPDQTCLKGPTNDQNSYKNKGCFQAIIDAANKYNNHIIGVLVAIFLIEVILVILAIITVCSIEEDED